MNRGTGIADLYRRIGGVESRIETLSEDSSTHTGQIRELEITTSKILGELEKTNSALVRMEVSLKIVEEIAYIKKVFVSIGTVMEKTIKVIKIGAMAAALGYAAYTAFNSGDITTALSYLQQLMSLDTGGL